VTTLNMVAAVNSDEATLAVLILSDAAMKATVRTHEMRMAAAGRGARAPQPHAEYADLSDELRDAPLAASAILLATNFASAGEDAAAAVLDVVASFNEIDRVMQGLNNAYVKTQAGLMFMTSERVGRTIARNPNHLATVAAYTASVRTTANMQNIQASANLIHEYFAAGVAVGMNWGPGALGFMDGRFNISHEELTAGLNALNALREPIQRLDVTPMYVSCAFYRKEHHAPMTIFETLLAINYASKTQDVPIVADRQLAGLFNAAVYMAAKTRNLTDVTLDAALTHRQAQYPRHMQLQWSGLPARARVTESSAPGILVLRSLLDFVRGPLQYVGNNQLNIEGVEAEANQLRATRGDYAPYRLYMDPPVVEDRALQDYELPRNLIYTVVVAEICRDCALRQIDITATQVRAPAKYVNLVPEATLRIVVSAVIDGLQEGLARVARELAREVYSEEARRALVEDMINDPEAFYRDESMHRNVLGGRIGANPKAKARSEEGHAAADARRARARGAPATAATNADGSAASGANQPTAAAPSAAAAASAPRASTQGAQGAAPGQRRVTLADT